MFPKNKLLLVLLATGIGITGLIAAQAIRIAQLVRKGTYDMVPYQHLDPNATLKILFLGDSTAVGIGAATNQESVAGWFAKDFPQAHLVNNSYSGRRLHQLLNEFQPQPGEHYDLAVLQIGANDIIKLTPYSSIQRDVAALLAKVKMAADHTVILHSGNVGEASTFIWPFNRILTARSIKVRRMYQQTTAKFGAVYVDLFERFKTNHPSDGLKYYAPDRLHLNGLGYRRWYQEIRKAMAEAGIPL